MAFSDWTISGYEYGSKGGSASYTIMTPDNPPYTGSTVMQLVPTDEDHVNLELKTTQSDYTPAKDMSIKFGAKMNDAFDACNGYIGLDCRMNGGSYYRLYIQSDCNQLGTCAGYIYKDASQKASQTYGLFMEPNWDWSEWMEFMFRIHGDDTATILTILYSIDDATHNYDTGGVFRPLVTYTDTSSPYNLSSQFELWAWTEVAGGA